MAVSIQRKGESMKVWTFKALQQGLGLDLGLEGWIGFKLGKGSKGNHLSKDRSQYSSCSGKEGIVTRMISKEQITELGATSEQARCKK